MMQMIQKVFRPEKKKKYNFTFIVSLLAVDEIDCATMRVVNLNKNPV